MEENIYYLTSDSEVKVDLRVMRKTKWTHPYNYDPFIVWELGCNEKATDTVYTDRLLQWDYKKYNELCKKHFGNEGQLWNRREPEKIQEFLRDYIGKQDLILVRNTEYCNQATGYPVWRLDYRFSA